MGNIPRIIHQIWIGSNLINPFYYNLSKTWIKYHPTWKYVLWDNDTINSLNLTQRTKNILDNLNCNLVIKVDLIRYEILNKMGGLCVDMDMECLRPFDLLFEKSDFICGIESNVNIIGSALIGCVARHKAIQDMIEHIQSSVETKCPSTIYEHLSTSGPIILDGILKKYPIKPMPQECFYPISWNEYEKYDDLKNQFPNSYSKHWWRGCIEGGWTKSYEKYDATYYSKFEQSVSDNNGISIVTRTMGRLEFLKKSIPTWCIKGIDKIIIVDWGMKEDLLPLLQIDKRITLLRIPNQKYFDEGITRNVGIRFAESEYIFTIDCDIILNKFPVNPIDLKSFIVFKWEIWETGTCIFPKQMWALTNGYFEGLPGWGDCDVDFYERAMGIGYKKIVLQNHITHQFHSNELRTFNFPFKGDLGSSQLNNRKIMNGNKSNQIHSKYKCLIIDNKGTKAAVI